MKFRWLVMRGAGVYSIAVPEKAVERDLDPAYYHQGELTGFLKMDASTSAIRCRSTEPLMDSQSASRNRSSGSDS